MTTVEVAASSRCQLVLIALAGPHDRAPRDLVQHLQRGGAVVSETHGADGCLRVATAVGPTHIVLDPRLPRRLLNLLRAHPRSAPATICWLDKEPVRNDHWMAVRGCRRCVANPKRGPDTTGRGSDGFETDVIFGQTTRGGL